MLIGKYVNEKGDKLENSPEFKQMLLDFKWALDRTISYANSKGASSNVKKADELVEKYKLDEVRNG